MPASLFLSYHTVVVCLCAHSQHRVTDSSDRFMAQEQNSAHPFTIFHQLFFHFFHFSPLFVCVSFHFSKVLHIRQVKGNAGDGRSRHQSFRVCKVNLATLKVAIKSDTGRNAILTSMSTVVDAKKALNDQCGNRKAQQSMFNARAVGKRLAGSAVEAATDTEVFSVHLRQADRAESI